MALALAGNAAMAPASPQPFTPGGLVVQRVPMKPRSREGRSSAAHIHAVGSKVTPMWLAARAKSLSLVASGTPRRIASSR
jgi:hypothetical protein